MRAGRVHARSIHRAWGLLLVGLWAVGARAENWSRFRGPNGQGAAPKARIPVHFGGDRNLAWRRAVGPGHSSPVIWGSRLFLTAWDPNTEGRLTTLALDRRDGRVLWERSLRTGMQVRFHALNNPAASTPAVDAAQVYVYFGTFGLVCYDHDGGTIWQRRLHTPRSKYGMATSPIVAGDLVILVLDGDDGSSRALALDRDTGQTRWETPRPLFRAGWSTPVVQRVGDSNELVVLGAHRLTGYDLTSGVERWWLGGFAAETVGVPALGEGCVFACAAALGGRGDDRFDAAATWRTTLASFDTDGDGAIQRSEMTAGFAFIQRPELSPDNPGYGLPVRDMNTLLKIFDRDHDDVIGRPEWLRTMAGFAAFSHPLLAAVRRGASEDARPTHLAWESRRGIPETPSPLYDRGRLYLLRDGGLLTCLRAADGRELFRERIGASGQYIASPVAAGDLLVAASTRGVVSILRATDHLEVLARNACGERVFATPAPVGDTLYLRTAHHVQAFREAAGMLP